jgi:hypothetical protein
MTPIKRRRTIAALAVLGLGGGLLAFASPANATEDPPSDGGSSQAGTQANYSGATGGLVIECAWALPDAWYAPTWPSMTYDFDDTPFKGPYVYQTGAAVPPPCYQGEYGPDQADYSPTSSVIHIDVKPNADDQPNERWVELWAMVDSGGVGIDKLAVDFIVRHPDGSLKVQVPGYPALNPNGTAKCTGGYVSHALWGGVLTGQMVKDVPYFTKTELFDEAEFLNLCDQQQKVLFYGAFPISKHQPWGKYTVQVKADWDSGRATGEKTFAINVLDFTALRTDFTSVDYGAVLPGAKTVVQGDFVWGTGDNVASRKIGDGATVANHGNKGMTVNVQFQRMCLRDPVTDVVMPDCATTAKKRIDQFDAGFANVEQQLVKVDPIMVDPATAQTPRVGFGTARAQTLCPNEWGKLELSLRAPNPFEQGKYKGAVMVYAVDNKICETDNGGVFEGSPNPGPDYVRPVPAFADTAYHAAS